MVGSTFPALKMLICGRCSYTYTFVNYHILSCKQEDGEELCSPFKDLELVL